MRTCSDCGGDVGKGWTNPSDHDHCASCDIARALGSPIPTRREKPLRTLRRAIQRTQAELKTLEAQYAAAR